MSIRNKPIEDGIEETEFDSWGEFAEFLRRDVKLKPNLIWRGQRKENWDLKPSLDRLQRLNVGLNRKLHFENFEFAIRGRLGPNPPSFDNPDKHRELWSLGQHYGLASPLLDWTESPYVAAFFAFEKENTEIENSKRVIFALDKNIIESEKNMWDSHFFEEKNLSSFAAEPDKEPIIEIYKPKSHFNPNLVSQQGLFTIFYFVGLGLEEWIKIVFKDRDYDPVLYKFYLPNQGRDRFLIFLNRMNINHLTLFPGTCPVDSWKLSTAVSSPDF